jgi:hypothetical protein
MIYLRDLAIDSFVLLRSHWTVDKAVQLLSRSKATHAIIHRTEPDLYQHLSRQAEGSEIEIPVSGEMKNYYYLYTIEIALTRLGQAGADTSIRSAFQLHEYEATPVIDAYSDAEKTPTRSIIMDAGQIIGFFDAQEPPLQFQTKSLMRGSSLDSITTEAVPRTLKTEFPDKVPLQQTVSLLVSLSDAAESVGPAQVKLPIAVPVGTKLDIIIQPRRGFAVEGSSEAGMVVSDEEETVQFKLKAVEPGPGEVRVLAFNGAQRLGTITLKPLVVEADQALSPVRDVQEQGVAAMAAHDPDLYLLIFEQQIGGKPALTFRLKAMDPNLGLHFKPFGPIILRMNPQEYFNDFFMDIEKLPLENANDKEIARKKLAAKGAMLFQQVIPQDLQALLWALRNQIRSVQIQSVEPDIPWELCRLQGKENGRIIDGPFFCEVFALTRCLDGIAPKPALSLKNLALVIPKDSGLPYAASERDYMLSLSNGGRKVERIPATYLSVQQALAKGEYDGWHFTGHGGFRPEPNRSAMLLEKREEMTPEDLCGETGNLGLASPLVFLNACQIGRGAMSLTDIGGWAAQFLHAGAGAFIGAYWSIYDQAANDFALAFYSGLLSGMEIGSAVKEARLAIKPLGDPTWLAYTVFADPLARVV